MIENLLAVATGGALGAVIRASLIRWVAAHDSEAGSLRHRFGPALATLLANVLGCLILGAWLQNSMQPAFSMPPVWAQLLVATGLCGGLTTFSTLCADTVRLHAESGRRTAILYLLATLVGGFAALHLLLPSHP
jgi:CrcB protein